MLPLLPLSCSSHVRSVRAPTQSAARSAVQMHVALDEDSERLAFVTLSSGESSCKIYLFGACVASYIKSGHEVLGHRADSRLDGVKPISGGIPMCWPQFGAGGLQQHGFARNLEWTVESLTDGAEPMAVLELNENEYTTAMWPHCFECRYTVRLEPERLTTEFSVTNTGTDPFEFTAALHPYWAVSSVDAIKLVGDFEGKTYFDKLASVEKTAPSWDVTVSAPTDNVYRGVSGEIDVLDTGSGRLLTISSGGGWTDTVVWNPHGNEEMGFDSFVCVESARAMDPVKLRPFSEWVACMAVTPGTL